MGLGTEDELPVSASSFLGADTLGQYRWMDIEDSRPIYTCGISWRQVELAPMIYI